MAGNGQCKLMSRIDKKKLSERDICTKFITPALTRAFFACYPQAGEWISASVMRKLGTRPLADHSDRKSAPTVRKSPTAITLPISTSVMSESGGVTPPSFNAVLRFSWAQLIELIRLDDPLKRAFYENQCLMGNWSVRQLQRQIGSLLYKRTGLSTNKAAALTSGCQLFDNLLRATLEPRNGLENLARNREPRLRPKPATK